jgi:fringe protein
MVTTDCNRRDLKCKTGQVFSYYLKYSNATWFCSFDDDNYIILPNLIQVLSQYEKGPSRKGRDLYIGRAINFFGARKLNLGIRRSSKLKPPFSTFNKTVAFGTGGAGYCLNRHLVQRGKIHLTALNEVPFPDDVAVGYVVQHQLGVNITFNHLFHSHMEQHVRPDIPRNEIDKHVSFGHNNKQEMHFPFCDMPNTTTIFSRAEDPMGFRSLWHHLHEADKMQ